MATAAFRDPKKLEAFESIDSLLEALVGKSFASITKPRGSSGQYVGITWDMVYVDTEAETEEDLDGIPF